MTTIDQTGLTGAVTDWPRRAAALAERLHTAGKLHSQPWRDAVASVPRHVFVPRFYLRRDGHLVAISADDPATVAQWSDAVYTNEALVTKVSAPPDGGGPPVYLSSSSTPGLMTRMLESLAVEDGQRVLEIGTGTGYNAALLCHRLGAHNVVSIDIEPDLVDAAKARLAGLGWHPMVITGDGASGAPELAPFDRVIATCSVPKVPWAWIEQTRPGGVVLTDLRVGLGAGNLVRLTRVAHDRAEGLFDAGQASFMALRHTPGADGVVPYTRAAHDTAATESLTAIDPRTPWTQPVVWFLAAMGLGGHYRMGYTGSDPTTGPRAVCLSTPDGSRAEITLAARGDGTHTVSETGPTALWRQVEHAHHLWHEAGQPGWERLGLTVTPDQQTLYLDTPDTPFHMPALKRR